MIRKIVMTVLMALCLSVTSHGAEQALLGQDVTYKVYTNPAGPGKNIEMYHLAPTQVNNNTANDKLIIWLNKDTGYGPPAVTVITAHKYLNGKGDYKGTAFPNGQVGENGGYRKWPYGPIQEQPDGPPINTDTGITIHFVDTYNRDFNNTDMFMVDPRFNGSMVYTHQGGGVWRCDASVIVPVSGGTTSGSPINGAIPVAGFWVWIPIWKKTDGSPINKPLGDLSGYEWRSTIDRIIQKAYYEPASLVPWSDQDWSDFARSGINNSHDD